MTATSLTNPLELEIGGAGLSAHPLYPVEQVFLWLPGFPGEERPYCTYNEAQGIPALSGARLYQPERLHDGNGAFYSPLFPIDAGTYVCWHLHVAPPFPFHGVPVTHSLTAAEMGELAQRVMLASEEEPALFPDPVTLLRNDRKCFVLACLSRMGLLSASVPHRR